MRTSALLALFLLWTPTLSAQVSVKLASDMWPPFTNVATEQAFTSSVLREALHRSYVTEETSLVVFREVVDSINNSSYDGSAIVSSYAVTQKSEKELHSQLNQNSESFYQHRIAVFSGIALIQGAVNEEGESRPRPIPVLGFDYEYFIKRNYGVGLFNDLELANYVIPFKENDVLRREFAFVTALVGLYEPVAGITVFAGPGYEFETHKNFPLLKLGAEFAKGFEGGWSIGVALSYDIKEVNSALSLGLTAVMGVGKPK